MSDAVTSPATDDPRPLRAPTRTPEFEARLRQRYKAEKRFKYAGLGAIIFSVVVLLFLLATMTINGIGGFQRAELEVPIDFTQAGLAANPAAMEGNGAQLALEQQGLPDVVEYFAQEALGAEGAEKLGSQAWREVADAIADDPGILNRSETFWLPTTDDFAQALEGDGSPELQALATQLSDAGQLDKNFDSGFLARADATDPQEVGIWGALKGSILTMIVTLLLAFPIGVLAALYLEEFAPKNRWTDVIEVSINNLAAVPSIIFGLLGLAVFLTIFPNYRSAPLIGGLTLALMTMPVIVIAGRNAIKAVPPSIRDGALAIGASPMQVVFHHVLPLALPGILTGTIIGMARALGETAPLLLIGMRAFIATPPEGFTSPATVLPVQIFLWSDEIDRGFVERTSAAIIVLLLFLLAMNAIAIYLRNRFEKSW
ncbi:MAG: phosphate ABC transporter, permease protein PstA [Sphingomonadales bacterium CG12_big_fil_rev_8_21_14_0_65_65_10]|uniref:phosphate ABC transporter permease PstA n=1 Tax=Blastomonas marina TaxID=1867408 RepID=UPI000CAE115C|nr:phosphate ABC transporter permease PstA [Blastomonas marina]PIW55178.1 MAG: phosphate ABC transporter, permease protein PstA [Sphingomonadales bacterium CG12_big_fil_rev_8_21_14_0_65_65_10]WPZ03980.1 phosphate ABC transporter permease PstA [Blastomonas marina]